MQLICEKTFIMTSVAQRFALWAQDEEISGSIPGTTKLGIIFSELVLVLDAVGSALV